jgi:hypothetical protein
MDNTVLSFFYCCDAKVKSTKRSFAFVSIVIFYNIFIFWGEKFKMPKDIFLFHFSKPVVGKYYKNIMLF